MVKNFKNILLIALIVVGAINVYGQQKREFRGAWIQAVNGQFQGMSKETMQKTLSYQLDELQKDGVNTIIFQVRPECDALYPSTIEPWSRFLAGQQGENPGWDPLQWMITESHKRGMELHAWINPYRAKSKGTTVLSQKHICVQHPERYFEFDGLYVLNPALKENRDYICQVAEDIVTRYDIDGFHIDDYFYPYPAPGVTIPDQQFYESNKAGFKTISDWRRNNVNLFIRQLQETIKQAKPWVKFGVSPFGIYRNKKTDPKNGSETNGLQNYDDLYADVLLWVNNGWVDYCVPQIYWEIGNKAADYETLIKWWNKFCGNRPLFIGEDVERTVKFTDRQNPNTHQMAAKYKLHSQMQNVQGTVLWYAKAAVDNVGNYGTMLRQNYWRYPALQPAMTFINDKAPKKVRKMKPIWTADGYMLFWFPPKSKTWQDEAKKYVVYRFNNGEKVDVKDPSKIVAITENTYYKLPYEDGKTNYIYFVTALDRLQNESAVAKKKVKL